MALTKQMQAQSQQEKLFVENEDLRKQVEAIGEEKKKVEAHVA